jgi:hypothetical protein
MKLKAEGDSETITRVRVRIPCYNCGEPAMYRYTYLLDNARQNPASSAFGRDDCSWCSDHEEFTCYECTRPTLDGLGDNARFTASDTLAHMFLRWENEE